MRESRHCHRYLGLELAGAKNNKTTLAALEYYPKERKVFLLDLHDRIHGSPEQETSDEALLALILEDSADKTAILGVNVPLQLPPCIPCTRKSCPMPARCSVTEVKWMQGQSRKIAREKTEKAARIAQFTPYTQRPVELYVRHAVLPAIPSWARFEIDESLGGTKAPLTARMNFLRRHLTQAKIPLLEAWPKLTIALLASELGLDRRVVSNYRHLEQGVHAREVILERIAQKHEVFIYERDARKMTQSLACFDAFVCAYTAMLADQGRCAKPPRGFPVASGWVEFPRVTT